MGGSIVVVHRPGNPLQFLKLKLTYGGDKRSTLTDTCHSERRACAVQTSGSLTSAADSEVGRVVALNALSLSLSCSDH